jgi:hypothetical protein
VHVQSLRNWRFTHCPLFFVFLALHSGSENAWDKYIYRTCLLGKVSLFPPAQDAPSSGAKCIPARNPTNVTFALGFILFFCRERGRKRDDRTVSGFNLCRKKYSSLYDLL